jgi:hypothetical protein
MKHMKTKIIILGMLLCSCTVAWGQITVGSDGKVAKVAFQIDVFCECPTSNRFVGIFRSTDMDALRAMVSHRERISIEKGSTDRAALRAMVSRRERISIEKGTYIPAFARRASTSNYEL